MITIILTLNYRSATNVTHVMRYFLKNSFMEQWCTQQDVLVCLLSAMLHGIVLGTCVCVPCKDLSVILSVFFALCVCVCVYVWCAEWVCCVWSVSEWVLRVRVCVYSVFCCEMELFLCVLCHFVTSYVLVCVCACVCMCLSVCRCWTSVLFEQLSHQYGTSSRCVVQWYIGTVTMCVWFYY